ncbi:MAG: aminopeptidase [Pseudomonadota bacterium]
MKNQNIKSALLTLTTLLILLTGSGCRLAYVFHAAAGQFSLLSSAVPIQEGLEKGDLTPQQKDRLRLVARVKDYGEKVLGLKETRNYRTVSLKSSRRPIYVVSASPKDRLAAVTWWFPIVGRMPYLGFFDRTKAEAEANRLKAKDLDVMLGAADAYSTLGWFEDPVTLNLIEGSTPDLVETLLHEMTHTTLYVKGQPAFNEGLANLVGKIGCLLFFQENYGPAHPFTLDAEKTMEDERLFSPFLSALLDRLQRLYGSPLGTRLKLAHREQIFEDAKKAFSGLESRLKTSRFKGFGAGPMNNAVLMSVGIYHRHYALFESVFEQKGRSLKAMIRFFEERAKEGKDMIEMIKG